MMVALTILYGILTYIVRCEAHLNLYMDVLETYRLLGLKAELFYVRKGIINDGALRFIMPVPVNVNKIFFTWQNLRTPPPPMEYKMSFAVSNPKAMQMPFANISKSDTVPLVTSAFEINLLCTGDESAEVQVSIQLNITIFPHTNFTVLNFKRRKLCRSADSGDLITKYAEYVPPDETKKFESPVPEIAFNDTLAQGEIQTSSTHVFYIAVGCACGVILLVAIGVAVFYITTQKSGNRGYTEGMSNSSSSQALTQHSQLYLRVDTPNNAATAANTSGAAAHTRRVYRNVNDLDPEEVDAQLRELKVERNRISIQEVLLEGTFGKILRATLSGDDSNNLADEQEVFIKTVTDQARDDQIQVFLTQCCLLHQLSHENLNPVLRTYLDDSKQPLILYQYTDQGNLKKFLQKCRVLDGGSHYSLSTQQRVYMAIQLIRGVQYLHRKRVLHRDIAARNCVIDSGLMLRLSDNALSRDLFPADYNCLGDNENRPVKWLAPEALTDHHFSPASDSWSFGVTLWELMTLAQLPYANIDPLEMSAYLREGYRIQQPPNCPDELFTVMSSCWSMAREKRPKISHLLTSLTDFYTALGRFV